MEPCESRLLPRPTGFTDASSDPEGVASDLLSHASMGAPCDYRSAHHGTDRVDHSPDQLHDDGGHEFRNDRIGGNARRQHPETLRIHILTVKPTVPQEEQLLTPCSGLTPPDFAFDLPPTILVELRHLHRMFAAIRTYDQIQHYAPYLSRFYPKGNRVTRPQKRCKKCTPLDEVCQIFQYTSIYRVGRTLHIAFRF